nr:carbohydrate-binding, CenC-like protein [Tanacetum cinerariifolium]
MKTEGWFYSVLAFFYLFLMSRIFLTDAIPYDYSFNTELQVRKSKIGNEFVVANQRNQSYDSVSQEFILDEEKLYTFSGADAAILAGLG